MGVSWSGNNTGSKQVQTNDAELINNHKRKIDFNNQSVELESSQTIWQKSLLGELYTCPICMDLLYPFVLQCDNAHSVCNSCAVRLDSCPVCRGDRPYWRNLWMEKLTERLRWPCRNAWRGCKEIVPAPRWHEHADSCTHTPPPVDEEEHDRKMEEFETWLERRVEEELE